MSNEISNEVRAKEIHTKARSYYDVAEQYAYKFLMELKTLRDERLFRELGYSSFEKYCNDEWGVTRQLMNQRIQLADEFGENVENRVSTFGHSKSLLLVRMEPEIRADVMENGVPTESGRKPAEEATRAEIEAYHRTLKEKEAEIEAQRKAKEQAEQSAEIERRERERLEEENAELIAEQMSKEEAYDEPETETIESRTPYGAKLGQAMYGALRELSEWQKEYSWIITDANEFRKMYEADANFAREFTRVREFWKQLEMAVGRNEGSTVVDADFSVIN